MSDEKQVAFVARYEDGEEWFMATVSAPGEAMAYAARLQGTGRLPPGLIIGVEPMLG